MSSATVTGPPELPTEPTSGSVSRDGVGVWCDRAILGHGVVAVVGRSPQLGRPVWLGDGLHAPPPVHQVRQLAVLVVVWDAPEIWPQLRTRVPQWLATGVSVVLVGRVDEPEATGLGGPHPRLRWCSPQASASELTAAIAAGAMASGSAVPQVSEVPARLNTRGRAPALSVQEQRVLELVTTGLKVSAVARRLDVSPHTVHTYLRRIRRKMAEAGTPVASPLELYRAATLWRLVAEQAAPPPEVRWSTQPLGFTG